MGASKVFTAMGKMIKNSVSGSVKTTVAGMSAGSSLGKAISNVAIGSTYGAYKLGTSIFKYDKSLVTKGGGTQLIPIKMKKGLGMATFGAMTAYGVGKGYADSGAKTYDELKGDVQNEVADSRLARTTGLDNMMQSKPIDNMGATGDLVFGLHNRRK